MNEYESHIYSEVKGKPKFNWLRWLKSKKPKTNGQWAWAKKRAASWVTCACGNTCAVIPRDSNGAPKDFTLSYLGGIDGFFGAISRQDVNRAIYYLGKIERRAKYILLQMRRDAIQKDRNDCFELTTKGNGL